VNSRKDLLRIEDRLSIAYFVENGVLKALILSREEVCEIWNSFPAITLRDYNYWLNKLRKVLNAESYENDQPFKLFKRGNIHIARAVAENSILSNFEIKNFEEVINEIQQEGVVVIINVKHDEELYKVIDSRIKVLERKVERTEDEDEEQEIHEELERLKMKLRDIPVLVDLIIAARDFAGRLRMMNLIKDYATVNIKWELSEVTWDDLLKMLESPNSKLKIGKKIRLTSTYKSLKSWLCLPISEEYLIALENYLASKEYLEPLIRSSKNRFRIGKWIDGNDAIIPADDLYYCYILSPSGFRYYPMQLLRILVHNLRNEGAVIVLDTEGKIAQKIAKEIPDSLYLHPTDSPFGVNPLDLPKVSSKDKAESIVVNRLQDILCTNIGDQRIKDILENTVKILYDKGAVGLPRLYRLFKLAGEGLVCVEDEKLYEQMISFRELPKESSSFLLNILKPYAENRILRRITSKTTIPLDEILKPGKVTLFSIPESELGEETAYRIFTAVLFRIWSESVSRGESSRIFVVIVYTLGRRAEIFERILRDSFLDDNIAFIFANTRIEQLSEKTLLYLQDLAYLFVFNPIILLHVENKYVRRLIEGIEAFEDVLMSNNGMAVFNLNMTPHLMTLIKIDDFPYKPIREEITTEKYAPQDDSDDILEGVGHPVLKYMNSPFRLPKQRSLHLLYRAKHSKGLEDLLNICKNSQDLFGTTFLEDPYPVLYYFHKNIDKITKSEEGRKIAEKAIEFYIANGYCVDIAKQLVGEPRPDLIAVPLSEGYLDFFRAIAIEIDTTTPDKCPTQLWRNWTKESVEYFMEIHTWIPIDKLEKVLKLYEELPYYLKVKIRIFAYDLENDVIYRPEEVHKLVREEKKEIEESFEFTPPIEEKIVVKPKNDRKRKRTRKISDLPSLDHFLREESEEAETKEETDEITEKNVITLPDGTVIQILDDLREMELEKIREYVEKGRYSIHDGEFLVLISEFGYKESVIRIRIINRNA